MNTHGMCRPQSKPKDYDKSAELAYSRPRRSLPPRSHIHFYPGPYLVADDRLPLFPPCSSLATPSRC